MDDNEYAKAREEENRHQLVLDLIMDVIGLLNSVENDLKKTGQTELGDRLHKEGVRTLHQVITEIQTGI